MSNAGFPSLDYGALDSGIVARYASMTTTATDQAGNVTLNAYDLASRLTSVTRGYGSRIQECPEIPQPLGNPA